MTRLWPASTCRPTGIVCLGPIMLLSTLPDPEAFIASMIARDGKASALSAGWPYAGYRLTVFATSEERAPGGGRSPGLRLPDHQQISRARGYFAAVWRRWQMAALMENPLQPHFSGLASESASF